MVLKYSFEVDDFKKFFTQLLVRQKKIKSGHLVVVSKWKFRFNWKVQGPRILFYLFTYLSYYLCSHTARSCVFHLGGSWIKHDWRSNLWLLSIWMNVSTQTAPKWSLSSCIVIITSYSKSKATFEVPSRVVNKPNSFNIWLSYNRYSDQMLWK